MKKIGILLLALFIFSIFLIILVEVQAQDSPPLPPEVEKIQELGEKLTDIGENLTDDEARRAYLSQEWQEILLKNKFVSALDPFFTKISIIFRILFGMPYSLSITLFFVIILWLVVFLKLPGIIKNGTGLSEGISWGISFAAVIILAQLQILKRIILFLTKFIFYRESGWARFIVFAIIIGILILLYYFGGTLSQYLEQRKKKQKEKETEQKQEEIKAYSKGLKKGRG